MKIDNTMPICVGTGLVALDVIISGISNTPTQFLAGGSCGNVITILSYLGWSTFPIARLSNNAATELLLKDLKHWSVNEKLLTISNDGSTPIIIHRIMKDQKGVPKHRFEFRNPEDGKYLPSYKPCLAKSVDTIFSKLENPRVFYFDRINRASIELAKLYKNKGAVIFFEPSSAKDLKGFKECLEITDILKFSHDRVSNFDELYDIPKIPLIIQTLGHEGLVFKMKNASNWTKLHSYSIENVVDAAGAGDWCTAGIIMSLFTNKADLYLKSKAEIITALKFGQALSSLNCTFEGARGLMYNILPDELLLYVKDIFSSDNNKHTLQNKISTKYRVRETHRKIASLFA